MKISGLKSKPNAAIVLLAFTAIFLVGCFGRKHTVSNYEFTHETQGARLPAFLAGPMAALLTNANGYSVKLVIEQTGLSNNVTTSQGQLLVRGSKMLYAPKTGDNAFIWDVKERNGYILSEALQGYAPVSSATHILKTMVVSETAGVSGETVNGHPGHETEVAITCDDGTVTTVGVWRASDMREFPVRIRSLKDQPGLTINLSNLRSEDLEPRIFLPPEGFTKYGNADSMVGELFARKSKSKNAPISSGESVEPRSGTTYSH